MPYQLEIIISQPPLLRLNIQGHVTALDMDEHLESLRRCIKANGWMEQPIYLIVDVSGCEMSFVDVITGAQTHSPDKRGSAADPLTHPVFLGGGRMIQLLRDYFMQISGGTCMPIVESFEEAIGYFQQFEAFHPKLAHK